MPYDFSVTMSPALHIMSNAFSISRITPRVWLRFLRFRFISSSFCSLMIWSKVLRLFRKPVCTLVVKTEFFSRYHTSLLATKRSITLQSVEVSAMGLYEFESCGSLPPLGKGSTIACLQLCGSFPVCQTTVYSYSNSRFPDPGNCFKHSYGIPSSPKDEFLSHLENGVFK